MCKKSMTKEIFKKRLTWALFYVFILIFSLYNSFNYLDPDLGWHLKIGEEILANKSVPHLEHNNYTLQGKSWVDHEWLSNITIFLVHNYLGYLALNIIFALLVVLIFYLLNNFTAKRLNIDLQTTSLASVALMILNILGVLVIAPHIGVRIQEIGVLFLLLQIIIIEKYETSKNKKTLFYLLPIIYFWSLLHGSFLIGVFILGLWVLVKTIEKLICGWSVLSFLNFSNLAKCKDIATFAVFSLVATFTTLLNPYGLKLYLFLSDYTNNFYTKRITEWLPAYAYPIQYYQLLYLSIAAAALLIYFINYKFYQKNTMKAISLWQFCLYLLFFMLAVKSRRHFPLFFVISLPTILQILKSEFDQTVIKNNLFSNLFTKIYIFSAFVLVVVSLLFKTNFTNQPFTNEKFCKVYPCTMLNFVKNNEQYKNKKVFNNYNWGGYMMWVWPEKQLFIDGRLPIYPYKDHTLLEEYYDFFSEKKAEDMINEYNIELVLLKIFKTKKPKTWEKIIFGIKERPEQKDYLDEYLQNSSSWELVYQDSLSKVFSKK